ncbi:AIR synthase family protein [Clostridium sp. 'deep sea']|uniref:AIR synthase family protein n=1 Tax=Clostridium sp. 'deep sea' TaxID=2779445 RepID=UPI0018968617|nr:AIR synthase family protein [Clostridium sp. 'deep sea']QOR36230.1 AIR synthase family protein [Clostridium sp. 'deep sea']
MEIGKLPPELLEQLILNKLTNRREEVLVRSSTGQDSTILTTNNKPIVLSTDPITGEVANIGWFAIHVACNDVAANGAEPVGVLLTLLLPKGCNNKTIATIMNDASQAASELNIDILGGHTELTDAVNRPVISTTALGIPLTETLVISAKVTGDLDIVLTKGAGIEGTAILANSGLKELNDIDGKLLQKAKNHFKNLSVVPESRIAVEIGVIAMHDVTEGGVLGALYEVAQAGKCGFIIDYNKIPVLPETKALCDVFNLDVLRLISSGSMLIFTKYGDKLVKKLNENNIFAAIIGKTTDKQEYLIDIDDKKQVVEPPESDEIWKVKL